MKYEVTILGVGKEIVQSDSFETQSCLLVFYNRSIYSMHKTCVAAFQLEEVKSVRVSNS